MTTSKQRGFTLVELLVVISIIGMLASITLVAVQGARDKAVIAAALQFATNNYHAAGANALLQLNFDNNLNDSSGNNNSVVFVGNATYQTDTPTGSGASMNNLATPVVTTSGAVVTLSPVVTAGTTLKDYTVSIWIKPTDFTTNQLIVYSDGCALRCINMQIVGGVIYMGPNSGGTASEIIIPTSVLAQNKWQNLTYTYTPGSPPTYKIYVNGKPSTAANTGAPQPFGSPSVTMLGIGNGFGVNTTYAFKGGIDDVAIYKQALTDAQIEEVYALGATKHGLAVK